MIYYTDKTCRTCLATDKDLNMLFTESKHTTDIMNMLIECTSIKIYLNDGLPQHICNSCAEQIISYYLFKQMCENSTKTLTSYFNTVSQNTSVKPIGRSMIQTHEMKKNPNISYSIKESHTFTCNDEDVINSTSESYKEKYECLTCKKNYKTKGHLQLHEKIHLGNDSFQCNVCFSSFYLHSALKNHVKTHDLLKADIADDSCSYECKICYKHLESQVKFNVHMKMKHTDLERRTCFACKQVLSSRPSLIKHIKVHMKSNNYDLNSGTLNNYNCFICDTKFTSLFELKDHDCKMIVSPVKCQKCSKVFLHHIYLQKHVLIAHKINTHQCSYCLKQFRLQCNLNLHLRIHTGYRPFACTKCPKTFHYSSGLKHHMNKHSSLQFKCKICHKTYKSNAYLRVHSRIYHCSHKFDCKNCKKQFSNSRELNCHLRDQHLSTFTHLCSACGYLTNSAKLLNAHYLKHKKEMPHNCQACGKYFRTQGILNSHSKVHIGEKKFSCSHCDKNYAHKSSLNNHNLLTHKSKTYEALEPTFKCRECNRKFKSSKKLMTHVLIHSGKFAWSCEICNHGFNRLGNYKIHLRRHTGNKTFICDNCGISFFDSSALKIHKRSHTGEKPYLCNGNACSAQFSTSGGLRRHKLRLHKNDNCKE